MYNAHITLTIEAQLKGICKETAEKAIQEALRLVSMESADVGNVEMNHIYGEKVKLEIMGHQAEVIEVVEG
ncbi:hypothetical protein [Alkalihalophilus marmarensis]|uniref:Uncharacterized protein n=1 Tax=Alkalihalophilus marmarensis DSM 21297 TaxID=1188261 RepID=U6SUM5_9BACI|nr:hypothetical protein [Alkalihalophilus marmarensis]ERN54341.1 hypothetical protein A33I_07950 [Alkalihalophilus marmarensis DSM 21297]